MKENNTLRRTGLSRRTSAFTLIELLVVIAIIAILAAILFPVFAQAREKARQSSCQSNLKQIGMGLLQYVQDYDETYPRSWFVENTGGNSISGGRYKWMDAINPYIKSEQIFNCPSASIAKYVYSQGLPTGSGTGAYGSYAINSAYYDGGNAQTSPSGENGVTLSKAEKPAETVWAADASGGFEFAWANTSSDRTISGTPRAYNGLVERHQGTIDVLWLDGHVKAMKLDRLMETHTVGSAVVMHYFTVEDD